MLVDDLRKKSPGQIIYICSELYRYQLETTSSVILKREKRRTPEQRCPPEEKALTEMKMGHFRGKPRH